MDFPTIENNNSGLYKNKLFSCKFFLPIITLTSIALSSCGGGLSDSYTSQGSVGNTLGNDTLPEAKNVTLIDDNGGNVVEGDMLTGSYDYFDADGDPEAIPTIVKWFRDDVEITGAEDFTYTVQSDDVGKNIKFGAFPNSALPGTTVRRAGDWAYSASVTPVSANAVLDPTHFSSVISATTVPCTLSNGSAVQCHELKFVANNIANDETGPFCPNTRTAIDGGIGIYKGALNKLDQSLWDTMVADGSNIIDSSDNVCTYNSSTMMQTNGAAIECTVNCLISTPDDTITVVHYIPVAPELAAADDTIDELEAVGTSLDGIPFTGAPPAVNNNTDDMTALDGCGGHHDASGYYHLHFVPESADALLANAGITGVTSCGTKITQDATALSGYAKDGYPIYANLDTGNVVPVGLDNCNGHTGATPEFPGGVYHYHASSTVAPSLPPCLKGASVTSPVTPAFE